MSSLAASIQEVGLLQPVLVREVAGEGESYELIAGERPAGGRVGGPDCRPSESWYSPGRVTS